MLQAAGKTAGTSMSKRKGKVGSQVPSHSENGIVDRLLRLPLTVDFHRLPIDFRRLISQSSEREKVHEDCIHHFPTLSRSVLRAIWI